MLAAQQRADDAELQLQLMSQQSETRAVGLESRLSELSETLGNVERLRQQDQHIIQKLRERLVQVCLWIIKHLLLVVVVLSQFMVQFDMHNAVVDKLFVLSVVRLSKYD